MTKAPRKSRKLTPTNTALNAAKLEGSETWFSIIGTRGLWLRVRPSGKTWIFRTRAGGQTHKHVLGHYPAMGFADARSAMIDLHNAAGKQNPITAHRERIRAARAVAVRKSTETLGGLLTAYVAHLRAMGRQSAREVEALFERRVFADKKLALLPAADISEDDVMPAFHKLTEAGLYREAEKLRSYLRAAYSTAKKARTNAGMYSFKGFAIRTNPLAELARPERPKGTGTGTPSKWALSADQLAHYWRRISEDKTPHGALLRFHLLTGGQRIEQLARLEREHYDADTKTILLLDGKGRRKEVFRHTVPLIPAAVAALEDMSQGGQYLFSVTGGRTPVDDRTVWEAVAKHAKAMLDAGEVDRLFSPGAIRKTVETRLAAGGTPDEALARLLSHGLGSVQARHYNEHKYADEKRAALETLYRLATRATANVTPIKRRNESGKRR